MTLIWLLEDPTLIPGPLGVRQEYTWMEHQLIIEHHGHTFIYTRNWEETGEPGGNALPHEENMRNATQTVTWVQD